MHALLMVQIVMERYRHAVRQTMPARLEKCTQTLANGDQEGAPGSDMLKPGGFERASSWLNSGLGLWLGSRPFSRDEGSGEGRAPEECRRPNIFPISSLLAELFARTCKHQELTSQPRFRVMVWCGLAAA